MRRTGNLIRLTNVFNKSNKKKTIIGWKTFNPKKIHRILPKIKKILRKINKILYQITKKKQKDIIKKLISVVQQEKMSSNVITKKVEIRKYTEKNNLYSSFFITEKKENDLEINVSIRIQKNDTNITSLYHMYLYLNKIINHLQKANVKDIILKPKKTTYTVLRSPHADKKTREQFAKGIYSTKVIVNQYASIMRYFNRLVYLYTKPFVSSYKYRALF